MPNWETFRFELRYSVDNIKSELIEIEAYRLSLNKLILPREWAGDLQHLYIARSVHGTTAIEGNPLSEDEVSRQLQEGAPRTAQDQLHRQTENAGNAFKWVVDNFPRQRPIQLADILTIHEILTAGSDEHDNVPGRLRESGHNVTVGSPQLGGVHRGPPGGPCIKRLLRDFIAFINSRAFKRLNTVIQALVAHFYFVTLHPFGDGNGRATRCIEAAILFGGGYNTHGFYSLSNYFYRNRDEYIRTLQKTRTEHRYDLTEFLRFGLRGFREELESVNAYVRNRTHRLHYRELIRRCTAIREGVRRRLLNEREARLLHRILDMSKPRDPFSNEPAKETTWADLMEFCASLYEERTTRTMIRELRRLQTYGFIHFERERGRDEWRVIIDFDAIARY